MQVKRQIAVGLASGLLLGAVIVGILGSILPAQLRGVLVSIEASVPTQVGVGAAVLLLLVLGLAFLRTGSAQASLYAPLVPPDNPPERPSTPPAQTGAEFDDAVDEAARAVLVEYADPAETPPYERLQETAVSIVARGNGVGESDAEAIVAEGRWTDDPVAAGFLSSSAEYPRLFRLFRWARPELAYMRAVTRTTKALHALAAAEIPGYVATADSTSRGSGRGEGGGRVRGVIVKLLRGMGLEMESRELSTEVGERPPHTEGGESNSVENRPGAEAMEGSTQSAESSRPRPAEVSSDE